jgi:hypothetical protein
MDTLVKNLKEMCNQALVFLAVSVLAVAKCILDGNMLLALVLIINATIGVMVLNCLCTARCDNLAWFYAVIASISVLATARILFN